MAEPAAGVTSGGGGATSIGRIRKASWWVLSGRSKFWVSWENKERRKGIGEDEHFSWSEIMSRRKKSGEVKEDYGMGKVMKAIGGTHQTYGF